MVFGGFTLSLSFPILSALNILTTSAIRREARRNKNLPNRRTNHLNFFSVEEEIITKQKIKQMKNIYMVKHDCDQLIKCNTHTSEINNESQCNIKQNQQQQQHSDQIDR